MTLSSPPSLVISASVLLNRELHAQKCMNRYPECYTIIQDILCIVCIGDMYHNEHPFSSSIIPSWLQCNYFVMYRFVHVAYLTYTVLQLPVFIWVFPPCRIYTFLQGVFPWSVWGQHRPKSVVTCDSSLAPGFIQQSSSFCDGFIQLLCHAKLFVYLCCTPFTVLCLPAICSMTACVHVHERMCNFACVCETIYVQPSHTCS